jgi:1-deoxy-D-xylulose-5-phosphate reductoisomerase
MTVPRLRTQSSAIPAARTVTLLGATGSIGTSTIDLLKRESKRYRVEAVTAHRNASRAPLSARRLRH